MTFSSDILIRILILALSSCGFIVARHIYKHKKPEHTPLVCPAGFDCNAVVNGSYSKFMGMPIEIFGMIYYALISIAYIFIIFMPNSLPYILVAFLIVSSLGAFLFSIYLIIVQIFVIKEGCSWCLFSALISILIFILTIFAYDFLGMLQAFMK